MRFAILIVLTLLSSAAGLVVEIVAGRMMAPYFGMSLQTWTVVISVVLLGFSLGHAFGGRIADIDDRRAWIATGISFLAASASTVAAGPLMVMFVFQPGEASLWSMAIAATAAFFVPSFAASFPTPFITRLAISTGAGVSGRALGIVYGASSLGAIAGSVCAGFVFVPTIGSSATMALMAGLYLAMGAYALLVSGVAGRRAAAVPMAIIGTVVLSAAAGASFGKGLCDVESSYFCIRVTEKDTADGRERHLVLNQVVHGAIDLDDPADLPHGYAAQMLASSVEAASRRQLGTVFVVGGGAMVVPARMEALALADRIVVAEIDPAVTRTVRERFAEIDISGIEVQHRDGRLALADEPDGTIDLLLLDAYSDLSIPEHLATTEFYELARRKLSPQGVMISNIIDQADRPRWFASYLKTAGAVMPVAALFREAETGDRKLANFIAVHADRGSFTALGKGMQSWPAPSDVASAPVQTDDRSNASLLLSR